MDSKLREKLYPTVSLLLICIVTTFLLALVYALAEETIQIRAKEEAVAARLAVMPEADRFEQLEGEESLDDEAIVQAVYAAYQGDVLVGYVFDTIASGYAGPVHSFVGVDAVELRITGLRITDSSETPGLGGNASKPSFYTLFEGMGGEGNSIVVVKSDAISNNQIEALSSATVTTYTVVNQANAALETAAKLLEKGAGS